MLLIISKMEKNIKEIDLFSIKPKLYFKQKEKFGTKFGGVLSIISIIAFIFCGYNLLSSVYSRKNFNIIHTKETIFTNSYDYSQNPFIISITVDKSQVIFKLFC